MSLMGPNITQSVPGLTQAERAEARSKRPAAAGGRSRAKSDEAVVNADSADAVRGLKSNDQEETREDRQEHPPYTPKGGLAPQAPGQPRIDMNG